MSPNAEVSIRVVHENNSIGEGFWLTSTETDVRIFDGQIKSIIVNEGNERSDCRCEFPCMGLCEPLLTSAKATKFWMSSLEVPTFQPRSTEIGSRYSVVHDGASRDVQEEGGLEGDVLTSSADHHGRLLLRVGADIEGVRQSKSF